MNRQVTDEQQYLDLLESIVDTGHYKGDRTGTGTYSKFGQLMRFDLTDNKLPLLTTKQMYHKSFCHETLWFISGSTDIKYLKDHGISIWDSWVIPETATYRELSLKERSELLSRKGQGAVDAYVDHIEDIRGRFGEMKDLTPQVVDLHHCFLDKYDIPRQVLASGSIGPGAYGAMWRNIEDTRVIPYNAEESYKAKGFSIIASVGNAQSVVSRKIDQLQNAIGLLRTNPDSRRVIVHTFDNRMVDFCALPPCHSFFQFLTRELRLHERAKWFENNVSPKTDVGLDNGTAGDDLHAFYDEHGVPRRALTCLLYQRSMDTPVGAPFNFSQYSLLTHMVAQVTGMVAEEFVHFAGDAHVYADQVDLVEEQIKRPIIEQTVRLILNPEVKKIDDFIFEDIQIVGYDKYAAAIKYPVAV